MAFNDSLYHTCFANSQKLTRKLMFQMEQSVT